MEIKELRADDVRATHPDWLIWRLGERWWAMNKHVGNATGADSLPELDEELYAYERQLLAVITCDERTNLRHGVDQSGVPQILDHLTGGTPADLELPDQIGLAGDSLAGLVGAVGDAGVQDLHNLSPDRSILPQFDHEETIDACDRGPSFRHECKRVHTSAHERLL